MKYPDDFINKVICGDCLEVMKDIPDKSVDLVLTDPPYGVLKNFEWDNKENFISQIKIWISEMLRISANGLLMFCAEKFLSLILADEQTFQRLLIWDKKCGVGSINNGLWYSTELIAVFAKGDIENKGMKDYQMSIFSIKKERLNYQYGHPTQKPLQLIRWLLEHYSNKDDLILDPFLGSGTTAVGCKELGRKFIGIEINPEYCKIANERLRQEVLPL